MTFDEALIALKAGSRIRHDNWFGSDYVCLENDQLYSEEGSPISNLLVSEVMSSGWRIVEKEVLVTRKQLERAIKSACFVYRSHVPVEIDYTGLTETIADRLGL